MSYGCPIDVFLFFAGCLIGGVVVILFVQTINWFKK
jgi:hypothetical protein